MLAQELIDLRALADVGAVAIAAVGLALVLYYLSKGASEEQRLDATTQMKMSENLGESIKAYREISEEIRLSRQQACERWESEKQWQTTMTGILQSLQANFQASATALESVIDRISNLDLTVSNTVDAMTSQQTANEKKLDEILARLEAIQHTLNGIKGQVTVTETEVKILQTEVEKIKSDIQTNEEESDGKPDTTMAAGGGNVGNHERSDDGDGDQTAPASDSGALANGEQPGSPTGV